MKSIVASLLVPALLVSGAAIVPEARDGDVPAQCAWNGYTKTNFKGQETEHQSIVTFCNQLAPGVVTPGLLSAKVTLGGAVCLYSSTVGCQGSGLKITTKGNPDLRGQPTFHFWRCGNCVPPPS